MPLRKTWQEMLEKRPEPSICAAEKSMMGIPAGTRMLISSPVEIRDYVLQIPPGQALPVSKLREDLAARHGAEVTCPMTTGIYLRIVAEAALDELAAGKPVEEIAAFWRVVGPKDKLAKRIRCGPEFIQARREAEGISPA